MCAALFWTLSAVVWADDFAIIRQNSNDKDFTVTVRITRTHPDLTKPLGVNLVRSTEDADEIDQHWDVDPAAIKKTVDGDSTEFVFTLLVSADKY